ncbi:heme-copper oxidase subunit III [Granulicella cerasi]|uniref:Heme-copper oxidase subunit III n=1 Tax=Granulicella cerasi TaxID=741063 RepID=A0ABW1Z4I8_9BACT|nr:cytochrome c oxidase subunit 3 [Granulicella cerasi]
MPTVLTPPEIRHRPEAEEPREHDGGNGRRPPIDKKTGGNGEGDNWNARPQGSRGPRERLRSARVGLFVAVAGDAMFFVAIVSAFFVQRSTGHFDAYNHYINEWLPITLPSVLWINTAFLLLSSVTAEIAREGMFREHDALEEWIGLGKPISKRAGLWLTATLVLGALFLTGQFIAWQQLAMQHVYASNNPSSHYFYLITVAHAVHLAIGIGALVTAMVILKKGRSLLTRQIWVDCSVWYWHAMGLLWIFLFALLEFGQ